MSIKSRELNSLNNLNSGGGGGGNPCPFTRFTLAHFQAAVIAKSTIRVDLPESKPTKDFDSAALLVRFPSSQNITNKMG